MSKKRSCPKGDRFTVMTSEEATLAAMPKYNGFAGGYGAHGKRKYDRQRAKRALARDMERW